MDESALKNRLDRIERRQRLLLVLLVVPYLVVLADVLGVWVAGLLYAVVVLVGFAWMTVSRRRARNAAGQ